MEGDEKIKIGRWATERMDDAGRREGVFSRFSRHSVPSLLCVKERSGFRATKQTITAT